LAFMQRYRLFMGNNHTSQALPCLKTKHTGMRYNQQVIQHTLYFLQTGTFLSPTQRTTALY
ncbi:hypothetical protein, partial [Pseudoalteromonas sp. P1-30]|uniref:hypothetical protein n=1 Tax=Pseudoalteromonas sp. P1-30 TaxID=1723760 RepID=UPI001F45E532